MATIEGTFERFDDIVSYKITEDQQEKIVKRLIEYYSTHCIDGEGIYQDDESIIDAVEVLSNIADNIIKFKVNEVGL